MFRPPAKEVSKARNTSVMKKVAAAETIRALKRLVPAL